MPYEIAIDPYIDPVSGVLKNKLGISNELELARSEEHSAVIAAVAITDECRPEKWDAAFLCWLHKELFSSHYEWAGHYRTVEISKGTSRFAAAEHIPTQVAALFHALEQELPQWKEGEPSVLSRLAHYYSEFNAIHPFREGNGRTIRLLLTLLALRYGWRLEWEHISAADNITACVKAFYGDEKPLCQVLEKVGRVVDGAAYSRGQDP